MSAYLIIGGGIAGITCARYLKMLDRDANVTVLAGEKTVYAKIALPQLLAGTLTLNQLEIPVDNDISVVRGARVTAVIPDAKLVETESAGEFQYDRLLLATGAEATMPELEGVRSPRVFTVRNITDVTNMDHILKAESFHKRVIIYGAGLVSMELADALVRRGYTVVILVSSGQILSQILNETAGDFVKHLLVSHGVEVHFREQILRIRDTYRGVIAYTKSGKAYEGDLLILGKGVQPSVKFLQSSGIKIDKGIVVNEFLETSRDGIYAAGDVCQVYDRVRKQKRVNALWPVAVEQGRHAALTMTGRAIPYRGSFARNVLQVLGHTIVTAGVFNDETIEAFHRCDNDRYAAIFAIHGHMAGFAFININIKVGVYIAAIEQALYIPKLTDVLLSGSLSYHHLCNELFRSERRSIQDGKERSKLRGI